MAVTLNANNTNLYNNRALQFNKQSTFQKLSSGKKINGAKDDAAGLAISEKMLKEINKANVEIENYQAEQSKINVTDGLYEGTSDYLMDLYEQGVRASNGLLSDSDKKAITDYQKHLVEDARSMLQTTKFNETKVADKKAIESLPENFDLDSIEKSMNEINSLRSKEGAEYNGLEHRIQNKETESYNLTAARSKITDTEYGSEVSNLHKNQTLETYRNMMQAQQAQSNSDTVSRLFN